MNEKSLYLIAAFTNACYVLWMRSSLFGIVSETKLLSSVYSGPSSEYILPTVPSNQL